MPASPSVEDASMLEILELLLKSESDTRGTVASLAQSGETEYHSCAFPLLSYIFVTDTCSSESLAHPG